MFCGATLGLSGVPDIWGWNGIYVVYAAMMVGKNAILDGCSTVDSKLDYDGIGWYSMVLHGTRWYFAIE